jgi:hypothetical protein
MAEKNLSIYEKISIMQERIKVNKSSRNTFADFNYRTIQDIFSELKPLLKELNLVITFGAGKLEGDKYTLTLDLIDFKSENMHDYTATGEIYIDRNKKKMDLSQMVLSAKTFLKKSLLEDLLLINEDEDPDSHDNTGKNTKTPQQTPKRPQRTPTPNDKKVSEGQLKRLYAISMKREIDVQYLDELIKKAFNLDKKENWLMSDYSKFMEYYDGDQKKNIKGHSNEETISMLIKKDNSKKK